MPNLQLDRTEGIATITLSRGKVNALFTDVVDEIRSTLAALEADPDIRAVILTGQGRFFSFGFDIPAFLSFSKAEFTQFLVEFTDLYTYLFLYPKPVIAALNGTHDRRRLHAGARVRSSCDGHRQGQDLAQ